MNYRIAALVAVLVFGTAHGASAQFEPSFLPPIPGSDVGIYLVDLDGGPNSDLGIHGIWRSSGSVNIGLRGGFIDAGDGVFQFGVETWGPIGVGDAPLDVAWTLGGGVSVNGLTTVRIPLGLSLGHTFDLGDIAIQPYGHPQLALTMFDDANDNLQSDLDIDFALGADFYLSSGLKLRLGVSLGDRDALGIGVAWRR